MAAGSTYTPIATTTLSSNNATVTFNSFSGYTDLVLVISPANTAGSLIRLQFNSDTGNTYSRTVLQGDGSSTTSTRSSSQAHIAIGEDAGPTTTLGETAFIVQIMNYSNSTTYKTVLSRENRAGLAVSATVGLWRNTAAITSIDIKQGGAAQFAIGSTFTLYGIAAA